jgi:hypothetical protein
MACGNRPPDEGWLRFAVRQLFLGSLSFPGDELLPARGWLRWGAIAFYVALALAAVALVVALLAQQ